MPHLKDPTFAGTLIYICEHTEEGALGIVVNQPTQLTLSDLFGQLEINGRHSLHGLEPVYDGGPVHEERGFILHDGGDRWNINLHISDTITLTSSVDILQSIAMNRGPEHFLVALGCAGWDANQLEEEMAANAWLSCLADPHILFNLPPEQRLQAAAGTLGVDLNLMTGQAGHA